MLRAFETDQLFNPDDCCGKIPDLARHAQQRNLNPKLCDTTPAALFGGCAGGHSLLTSITPKVLWRGVYRQEGPGLDRGRRREDGIHRPRFTLGKWLLRELQRSFPG